MKNAKIIAVIPGYNVAGTIRKVIKQIPNKAVHQIIVVNDGSSDKTREILKKIKGVIVVNHTTNKGYGASQKSGYKEALDRGADLVIMLHGDGQHDPKFISPLIKHLKINRLDLVLGNRIKNIRDGLRHGMPFYKVIANRFLSDLANIILGTKITEHHTGYRIFTRNVLKKVPLAKLSDDFIFDQQMIIAAAAHRFRIGSFPTSCIYHTSGSSINISRSIKYGLGVIGNLALYLINKNRFI